MDFDARIGRRFDLHGVSAHWEPHADTEWIGRLQRARGDVSNRGAHHAGVHAPTTNAILDNVSVSGAGVLAPADQRSLVGTTVTVTLAPGSGFEARIRRILPTEELGWAYFGVEFTSMTDGFGDWLDHVVASHRAAQQA